MADFYLQFSFNLPCTPDEARALEEAFEAPPLDLFDDPDFPEIDAQYDGETVWADTYGDPFLIGLMVQRFCPSVLPFGFTYAATCSRMRPGEIGGGYVLITADDVELRDAGMMLREELASHAA
jgi:hypothetical protein